MRCIYTLFILFFIISCDNKGIRKNFQSKKSDDLNFVQNDSLQENSNPKIRKRILRKIKKYEETVKKYSALYGIDWRLVFAIIRRESNFNENAISVKGAVGLMQIMPITEEDVKRDIEYDYIQEKPEENIAAGLLHLSKLLDFYSYINDDVERTKIALATYNAGLGHILDAISLCEALGNNASEWSNIKYALTKLTVENYELHLEVWSSGKPRYGYFRNNIETITYVDKIWQYYEEFKLVLASKN